MHTILQTTTSKNEPMKVKAEEEKITKNEFITKEPTHKDCNCN